MAKKIAVLGVTGHIGAQLAKQLVQTGIEVTGVTRNAAKAKELGLEGVAFREGSITDVPFLTGVLRGKDAAFIMIPPNIAAADNLAYQQQVGEAITEAVKASGLRYLVNLSSFGAEFESGTGPVVGVHRQEKRLNQLDGVNIVHLRPAYFFENTLANIPIIQGMNVNGSTLRAEVAFPAIATVDIASVAAQYLKKLDFTGQKVHELLGPRDITMREITEALGQKLGKRELPYVQFSYEDGLRGMQQAGMSQSMAELYNEFFKGMNEGTFFNQPNRTPETTTPTTFEEFVASLPLTPSAAASA